MSTTRQRKEADPVNGLLLPPAARLLHIGVHKSGTTSLQSAFQSALEDLGTYGITYRGGPRHQPAIAVTGALGLHGGAESTMADWDQLVSDVHDAGDGRVVVSSEYFSNADEPVVHRVVSELSDTGGPLHVVITLRPLHRIAPSQWQQYTQNRISVPYVEWLDGMFRQPPYEQPTPSFWRRHHQGNLVRRWAAEVGPENVTVVVLDENDPDMLMRTFESFVGLPEGFLVPRSSMANRSLTVGESELLRRLNARFGQMHWTDDAYARFVRKGVVKRVKIGRTPDASEPRLSMPGWALERAAEIGSEDARTITSLGVNVVGDIATLGALPDHSTFDEAAVANPSVPVAVAAQAAIGAIEVGIAVEKEAKSLRKQLVESTSQVARLKDSKATLAARVAYLETKVSTEPTVTSSRTTALVRELGRRARRRLLHLVGRA
jgi:hypothetical protein